ncbi:aminodeoxychorismate synthase component I [Geobacter anodireducens]|uniref:Aminobenzoate synthetase n=1 Tax=Geobacter soli TaxID=1510391 RepID=A0A0C1QKT1_9BACT|nr:aminodeoxychorismate synthase component I [Geobacter soli]KIE41222.1 aminobenzoate synthetase [Geobacter soli]HMN01694.1 aminodeoxychorismate synthase component I [Geobacter anodireducens]
MSGTPTVMLASFDAERHTASYRFEEFVEAVTALTPAQVVPALRRVEEMVAGGLHAAGFVSYEAAPGLDESLTTREPAPDTPLVWFGLFRRRVGFAPRFPEHEEDVSPGYETSQWSATLQREPYLESVGRIRQYITAGDCYQVNFTFRQQFRFSGDPLAWFHDLCRAQRAPFCAVIDTGPLRVLSTSPELFFDLRQGTLTCRPMKGTARRGRWRAEDEELRAGLAASEKERAENLMIVDLLRNDMGMVAETGSVRVESLFDVESLETLHQMTSTITARPRAGVGLAELFGALFPCGSVTGAPKRRSMNIIRELEDSPRGIYTGAIGYVSPAAQGAPTPFEATFSVAIRTAVLDAASGQGQLGIGSGVTIGSTPSSEYDECLAKSRFAQMRIPDFQLVETLLHEEGAGFFLLERHLARLYRSAAHFGIPLRLGSLQQVLTRRAALMEGRQRVRVLVNRRGAFTIQESPLAEASCPEPAPVCFAATAVDPADQFLYHKTTYRPLYRHELAAAPHCADVIFVNRHGEVTEGTTANLAARIDGEMVTPPLAAGILPGTFREELLAEGAIRERSISREELEHCREIYLINSVRRWRPVSLLP